MSEHATCLTKCGHPHSRTRAHTHARTPILTHARPHSRTRAHTHACSPTLRHACSPTLTHTPTLTDTHTSNSCLYFEACSCQNCTLLFEGSHSVIASGNAKGRLGRPLLTSTPPLPEPSCTLLYSYVAPILCGVQIIFGSCEMAVT